MRLILRIVAGKLKSEQKSLKSVSENEETRVTFVAHSK